MIRIAELDVPGWYVSLGFAFADIVYERRAYAKVGLLFNLKALWVGAHYSGHQRRLCINLVPCLTVWVTLPGGTAP